MEIIEDDFQSCIAKQIVPFEFDDINYYCPVNFLEGDEK